MQHFERAAEHFREAIHVLQDIIYGKMGVTGMFLVAFSSFELNAHPREVGTRFAASAVLIAFAALRWAFRRFSRRAGAQPFELITELGPSPETPRR